MRIIIFVVFLVILANYAHSQKIRVIENSKLAKLAARIKKDERYALTIGKTIFLSCKKEQFFADTSWMKHELVHVQQYKRHGTLHFLTLYFVYSLFHDYSENPFEKEALYAQYTDE